MDKDNKFKAALYVRLSHDDGNENVESNSVTNQKELIQQFIKENENIDLVNEYVDDGYTGLNFERPSFQRMIVDIKAGNINCVVVKDLSRFGRNYLETGMYLEQLFPIYDVRFISITDNYDTYKNNSTSDSLLIPFRNLINESYSRDISTKIRSSLKSKREKGCHVSAFAVYGYMKDERDKNKLVIDYVAAKTVKEIFNWKIDGMSNRVIADKLNLMGILSPSEYKKALGFNYKSGFKTNKLSEWHPSTISNILKNKVYIGVLEQGKKTTYNYKVKKTIEKDSKEWSIVENSHEPIISKDIFELVQQLLIPDTRTSPKNDKVFLFSGKLICSDCGENMIRTNNTSKGNQYSYFICSSYKRKGTCSRHTLDEKELENAVMVSIRNRISNILDVEKLFEIIDEYPLEKDELIEIDSKILQLKEELQEKFFLKESSFNSFSKGVIGKEDYIVLNDIYSKDCTRIKNKIEYLEENISQIVKEKEQKYEWIKNYKKYRNITELSRKMINFFIEKIYVYEEFKIDIRFTDQETYENAVQLIKNSTKILIERVVETENG